MSEKIHAIVLVARQIDGEYVFIRAEKAYRDLALANDALEQAKKDLVQPDGKAKAVNISTPQGSAQCFCEVGIFELEVQ